MERAAFARALQFLSYAPWARWGAFAAGVLTGILFVALMVILGLFIDLVINRGAIPCFRDLPAREKQAFLDQLGDGKETEAARLWLEKLPDLVQDRVGEQAGDLVRQEVSRHVQHWGPNVAVHRNLEDLGILSLVVRSRSSLQSWWITPIARWSSWTWRDGNLAYLQGLFLVALILAALRAGLHCACNVLAARAVIEAVTRLRRALYHHTFRLGTLAFRALGPSEAVGVSTRHLESVHDGLFNWLTVYFREQVKFVLLLLFAMVINFWLALAFLLFALLVWIVGGQIAAYFRRRGRLAEQRAADQLALLQESLMMMRLVKIYQMEGFNQARVERQFSKYGAAQMERYRGEAIYRPAFFLLGMLATLTLLLVIGTVILGGHLGVTSAVILATALVCLYWPLTAFLEARRLLRRSRQSARVLFEFLDRHGSVGQDVEAAFLPALSKHLEFDNVFLREPGTGRQLLQGVSLTIDAGQVMGLVGPDEMEKHALVYLLPRFLDPASGMIRIDKKDLRGVTLDSLRAQIAMVLQHNLIFNDTVANNISCGERSMNLARVTEAAKVAHAHQFIMKLPQGYETVIGDQGQTLNAGEMFRIALARAILRDPALVVIEEPLIPLDEDTKSLIDDSYTRFLPGRTVLFLPHRLSTIRRCDQVFLLYEGKVEGVGEHRELLANSDLYRHLQYLEFNEYAGLLDRGPGPIQVDGKG